MERVCQQQATEERHRAGRDIFCDLAFCNSAIPPFGYKVPNELG